MQSIRLLTSTEVLTGLSCVGFKSVIRDDEENGCVHIDLDYRGEYQQSLCLIKNKGSGANEYFISTWLRGAVGIISKLAREKCPHCPLHQDMDQAEYIIRQRVVENV